MKPDHELLDIILEDYESADAVYKAGEFWSEIVPSVCEHFRGEKNLDHFRRAEIRTGIRSIMPSNPGRRPGIKGRGALAVELMKRTPLVNRVINHYENAISGQIISHAGCVRRWLTTSYIYMRELV